MTTSFVATSVEGLRLAGTVSGTGDALLVALHGGPGGLGGGYLSGLHALAGPDRRVAVFDQLGTGGSERPPQDYGWSMAGAVADVDAVREYLGADRIDVLGHSYGGMLALQYALDHPSRVRRLVLSSTAPSVARCVAAQVRQVLAALPVREAVAALTADVLAEHDDPRYLAGLDAWLRTVMSGSDDAAAELSDEAQDPGPAGHGLWGSRMWFATGALRDWSAEERLSEITAPVLVVHGGRDSSDRAVNQVLADGFTDCEWITLNGCSHDPMEGPHADTYLRIVAGFLDRNPHE